MPEGWYSRGYLPHIEDDRTKFVTWRQCDAVPAKQIEIWVSELRHESDIYRRKELSRRIEAYCDMGHGSAVLRRADCARATQETLFIDAGKRYHLHAWSIMPNHVHVLLTPIPGHEMSRVLGSLKGASSMKVNRLILSSGRFWQRESFDKPIRDEEHFQRVLRYIEWNPVKAKLVTDPTHFSWSSANPGSRKRLQEVMDR